MSKSLIELSLDENTNNKYPKVLRARGFFNRVRNLNERCFDNIITNFYGINLYRKANKNTCRTLNRQSKITCSFDDKKYSLGYYDTILSLKAFVKYSETEGNI